VCHVVADQLELRQATLNTSASTPSAVHHTCWSRGFEAHTQCPGISLSPRNIVRRSPSPSRNHDLNPKPGTLLNLT